MSISGVITQIRSTDLEASIAFYTGKLGFELEFKYEDFYAGVNAGGQIIHLKRVDQKDPSIDYVANNDHFHLYFPIDDVEIMAAKLKKAGVKLKNDVQATPWGTRDLYVFDDQGHVLCFSETTE